MAPGTIALAAALVFLPGLALSWMLFGPRRLSIPTRLALVIPLGYAMVSLVSVALALLGLLSVWTLPAGVAVGSAVIWVRTLRRDGVRPHLRAWREEARAERWPYLLGLAVVVALSVPRFTYDPVLNLADQTPLRYWADGLEVAESHRIPEMSLQWGVLFPSAQSKVLLNAFHGAASLVLGRGPLEPMGALLVVVSVGLMLAGFALGRELGLRWTAPLVPVLLFGNRLIGPRDLTLDLTTYKAENWGRLVAIGALLLGLRALRGYRYRDRAREAVIGGALLGVAAATHLVPTMVAGLVLGAYAVGWGAYRRRPRPPLAAGGAAGAMAVLVAAMVFILAPGDIGFGGAADTSAYGRLADELGIEKPFDPTRFLALGELAQPAPGSGFYDPPSDLYHGYVQRAVGEPVLRRPVRWLYPVVLLAVGAILLLWGDGKLRAMAAAALALAATILAVTLLFNFRFDVYVLAEFGPRRLFDYAGVPLVLLGLGVVELAVARGGDRAGAPWVAPVAAALLVAVVAGLAVPRTVASGRREAFFRDALPALEWVERHVPCRGRVLADRRTLATFEALTRHAGVLEGMGPYLRPELLGIAVRSLLEARGFFADPVGEAGYLTSEGVGAVVVTTYAQTLGGVGGPLRVGAVDREALSRVDVLEEVVATGSVTVYRVTGLIPAIGPDVRGLPGYRCDSG